MPGRPGRSIRPRWLSAAVILLGGCGFLFGPDSREVDLVFLEFIEGHPGDEQRYFGPPSVTIEGGDGVVVVRGDILVPCMNFGVRAWAGSESGRVNVILEFRRESACATVVMKYAYQATVLALPAGVTTVVVYHELFLRSQGGIGLHEVGRATVEVT